MPIRRRWQLIWGEATAWLAHYRRFYEESLDRLGEHLSRLQGS